MPAAIRQSTDTLSPPTCRTRSATIVVVATTVAAGCSARAGGIVIATSAATATLSRDAGDVDFDLSKNIF